MLCLILLLLTMAVWHWRQCGDDRPSTDGTENLLHGSSSGPQDGFGHLAQRADLLGPPRSTRGRTSLDSTVSCVICMDGAINCVLMPCAHEIACQRCASRLVLCPVCRMAVGSTLKIAAADYAPAAQQPELPHGSPQPPHQPSLAIAAGGGMEQAEEGSAGPAADGTAASENGDEGTAGAGAVALGEAKPAEAGKSSSGMAAMLCLRCAANPPNCVFLPCSHKVWCTECAAKLPPACPICNTGITQSLRTFHKRL